MEDKPTQPLYLLLHPLLIHNLATHSHRDHQVKSSGREAAKASVAPAAMTFGDDGGWND